MAFKNKRLHGFIYTLKNFKLYGAIASFHIHDEAKHKALERGFFVLQRSGKVLHTECGENLRVM